MQERLDGVIAAALGSRIVGCVVLVNRGGVPVYARAAGLADREAGRAMAADAIFRLASVTKPVVAACALRMVDLGLIGLQDPVTRFLPGFRPKSPDGVERPITIHHLLTHTSGLSYEASGDYPSGLAGPLMPLDEVIARIAAEPLMFTPGTAWEYGMSTDVLGAVVAAVNGSDVAGAVARYVTGPLGMVDTMFGVTDAARLAQPYRDGSEREGLAPIRMEGEGTLAGTPYSVPWIFETRAQQSGGAGMAGTAGDVMRLLEALRGGFLSAPLRDAAFSNQIGDLPRTADKRFGYLGAITVAKGAAMPVAAVDWGGWWGHNWIVDCARDTTVVVCTNTTPQGCDGPFREEVAAAVFG